jgi:ribosomal protein S12 methylthiotransferase accessory factor
MSTTAPALESSWVNRGIESMPYLLDHNSHESLEELFRMYQPLVGPVKKCVTYLGAGGGFRVNAGHAEYFDLDQVYRKLTAMPSLDTGVENSLFGGGKGFRLADMQIGTLGEAVERVLGALCLFTGTAEQVLASAAELDAQGVNRLGPEEMHLFSEEQYASGELRYERWTPDTPVGWLEGQRLLSGERIMVPSQLVEMLHFFHPDEAVIGYSVSGGLSCHRNRREALFHGITEIIERDAINLRWTCGIPPHELVFDVEPKNEFARRLLREVTSPPINARIFYHSIDVPEVPVLSGIQLDGWLKRYSYNAGGGADSDADRTLVKALAEFGQSAKTLRLALLTPSRLTGAAVARLFDMDPDAPTSSIDLFFKVIGYYGYRQNRHKLDWYLEDNPPLLYSELPRDDGSAAGDPLDRLIPVLREHGWDPIVFDFTPPQFRRLTIVKVFMPELSQPFLPSIPMLGHPRFRDARKLMGLDDRELAREDLVLDPLPYP